MKKSLRNRGIAFTAAGLCLLLAAVLTESIFDSLLWGFAGGALGPGIGMLISYFYWSSPGKADRYREVREQEEINLHDELNEKLRDRSGRIAYQAGLMIICVSGVVFSILGKAGVITEHKIIIFYLFALLLVQIVIGIGAFHHLRKKY